MKKFIFLCFGVACTLLKAQTLNVLYDDFNGSTINLDYWRDPSIVGGTGILTVGSDPSGKDYYPFGTSTAFYGSISCPNMNNVLVSDGVCELRTTQTTTACYCGQINSNMTKDFSEGYIVSKQKYLYGVFEARIKLDVRDGAWPAFWLYGEDSPGSGTTTEIDIFEINTHWSDKFTNNFHWQVPGQPHLQNLEYFDMDGLPSGVTCIGEINVGSQIDSWHTYKMIWAPDQINWFFDGNWVRGMLTYDPVSGDGIFNYPMHVILNYSMYTGTNDWGDGSAPCGYYLGTGGMSSSFTSGSMYIDYVSIEAYPQCETIDMCNFDQSWGSNGSVITGHDILLGGDGCSVDLNITDPAFAVDRLELIASNEVVLRPGFSAISETESELKARIAPITCYSNLPNTADNQSVTFKGSSDLESLQFVQLTNTPNSILKEELISVSPNPTAQGFVIGIATEDLYKITQIEIVDVNGKLIQNVTLTGVETFVAFDAAPGIYLIKFSTNTGSRIKKLVKQ